MRISADKSMNDKPANQININEYTPAVQGHTQRLQSPTFKVCSEKQVFSGEISYAWSRYSYRISKNKVIFLMQKYLKRKSRRLS